MFQDNQDINYKKIRIQFFKDPEKQMCKNNFGYPVMNKRLDNLKILKKMLYKLKKLI